MPSLSDLKTQSLLEAILEELREIRKIVSEPRAPSDPEFDIPPYVPVSPYNPPREWPHRQCSKCGLSLEGVMAYSCPNADCPTGLGPTTC